MVGLLDLGFYLSDGTRGPDWQGSGTFLVTQPGAHPPPHVVAGALGRADVPSGHLLVATSGSTAGDAGPVRLVALSFEAFLASAAAVNEHLAAGPSDTWAHALPLFHVGGLGILARAWLSGSRVVPAVEQKWDARRYHERVTEAGATLSALVPSQVYDLVSAGLRAPASLRAIVVGGAALEPSLYDAARTLGWPCLPSYGMTETCSQVATAKTAGPVCPEVLPVLSHAEIRVDEEGRIQVRATSLLTCYVVVDPASGAVRLDDPRRAGWFETEDLGRLQPGGIEVIGRATDTVKVLGELVSLPAVESAIGRWLDGDGERRARVADFAVVSVPHPRLGAELVLALVPAAGAAPADLQTGRFVEGLHDGLRPVERPSRIVMVETVPRTALGKTRRARLSEQIQGTTR